MIPIISHGKAGDNGYTFDNFKSEFLNICTSHRQDNRALAFAFILYDFTQPQVAKALKDQDYWNALDQISGKYLSVFSFHTRQSIRKRKPGTRKNNGNVMHYMTSVFSEEFNDGRSLLEQYFRLDNAIRMPAILFFQVYNNEIIGTHLVQLTKEKEEDTFLEIKEIISAAAEAISEVKEENYGNGPEIFDLIERRLKDRGVGLLVKNTVKKIKSIKEIFSLFG